MARRKTNIVTHYQELLVRLRDDISPAAYGLHSREGLSEGQEYRVLATYLHRWEDGIVSPAFMVEGNGGRILDRVATIFEVVEIS